MPLAGSMHFLHAAPRQRGELPLLRSVTLVNRRDMERHACGGFERTGGNVQLMAYQGKPPSPPPAGCGVHEPALTLERLDQEIADFLAGRTHGEALLHALHDHVLDEPIPERMLTLLRQACRAPVEPD
jgi:hypothetical protein